MIESCFKGVGRKPAAGQYASRARSCPAPRDAVNAGDVVIIASGGANIASLQFALQRLGANSRVSADSEQIRAASHVILPGVGAAADAMSRLRQKKPGHP